MKPQTSRKLHEFMKVAAYSGFVTILLMVTLGIFSSFNPKEFPPWADSLGMVLFCLTCIFSLIVIGVSIPLFLFDTRN